MDTVTVTTIVCYTGRGIGPAAAAFARDVVAAAEPAGAVRARSLLWAASRLAGWSATVGLEPLPKVLLHASVIERFVTVGLGGRSAVLRRTARSNLRWLARRCGVAVEATPQVLARGRAKAAYTPAEIDAFFTLADSQPTESRRQRLVGLLCLGLGAGIEGGELRGVTGNHVVCRSGGVVVIVEGPRARVVPVLARYHTRLIDAARFAGDSYVCGGVSATRKNVTVNLVGRLAGGADLCRLEAGRLRATWLTEQLARLGVGDLVRAAGVHHAQHVWDLAARLDVGDETTLIARLG
jgi:integrase